MNLMQYYFLTYIKVKSVLSEVFVIALPLTTGVQSQVNRAIGNMHQDLKLCHWTSLFVHSQKLIQKRYGLVQSNNE